MKAHVFCMHLPYSDAIFLKAYPAETTEAFCDGHVRAFAFFGGVPKSIFYDYVPGHIIVVMCRSVLCGRAAKASEIAWNAFLTRPHNPHSDSSQFISDGSSLHTGLRGNCVEAAVGGAHAASAASFMRILISA